MLTLSPLNKASLTEHMPEALAVEAASGLSPTWGAENFLMDLPRKWELSYWALQNEARMGFAFFSEKSARHFHLHRFAVQPQGRGHGPLFLEALLKLHLPHCDTLSLCIMPGDTRALRFYTKHGFQPMRTEDNGNQYMHYIVGKAPHAHQA